MAAANGGVSVVVNFNHNLLSVPRQLCALTHLESKLAVASRYILVFDNIQLAALIQVGSHFMECFKDNLTH